MERFQYYLEDLSRLVGSKINGIIVCDHRQPKDDNQLRHFHQNLLIGSKENVSIYRNLVEGVFLTPSHLSPGIQLSDMIVGGIYRQFARKDSRYFDLLKSLFRRGPNGLIEGHDLILWPRIEEDAVSRDLPEPASIDAATAQI